MTDVRFDADSHRYWVEDVEYPSVSRVLRDMGLVDGWYERLDPKYRARGKAVHLATTYVDDGTYEAGSTHPEVESFVVGYRKFVADTGFKAMGGERPMHSASLRVCGTPDRWGAAGGGGQWLLDLKSSVNGDKPIGVEYQLGLYGHMLGENAEGPWTFRRKVLVLSPGDYELTDVSQARWLMDAEAAVRLWWQRVNWRLIKWPNNGN